LIQAEVQSVLKSGLGLDMSIGDIEVTAYSDTSAICRLTFTYHPAPNSELAGKDWTFTNVYGYRAESTGVAAGWEFVLRDHEVNAMQKATGKRWAD